MLSDCFMSFYVNHLISESKISLFRSGYYFDILSTLKSKQNKQ